MQVHMYYEKLSTYIYMYTVDLSKSEFMYCSFSPCDHMMRPEKR